VTFGSGGRRSIQLSYERATDGGRRISRVLSPGCPDGEPFLWDRRCRRPRAAYPEPCTTPRRARGGPPLGSCLALLRVGFALPPTLPPGRCALTATVSPLPVPPAGAIGGLFSVALSVALRRPAVSRHPALWSSDFPRRGRSRAAILTRLPDPSCQKNVAVPRRGLEPPRRLRHQILSLACLPVSAPGHAAIGATQPNTADSAPERTRTSTGLRPLDPESSASTNSATGA
jgi:hypothetical protein